MLFPRGRSIGQADRLQGLIDNQVVCVCGWVWVGGGGDRRMACLHAFSLLYLQIKLSIVSCSQIKCSIFHAYDTLHNAFMHWPQDVSYPSI